VHIHAIGVPDGVTLLEFEGLCQEEQPAGEVPDEVTIEFPDHVPCNFVKGKPRSIISLLISKIQLSTMLYTIALNYRRWMKTLAELISNSCSENIP
jgi:hypothetical protein